ncbi:MAG: efflux RND transporter periplasmic adaptor subunit [Oscillospiraceae bacterium]|nr:efflux RND transporter periplasmic adaptor subunit [Oscillospiraceae bacterium]
MIKKKKWIKWLILLLIAIAAVVGVSAQKGTKTASYTEVSAQKGDLTTYYNFDGLVYAAREQALISNASGTVKTVYVVQNQKVEKGDQIYRLAGRGVVKADIDGEVTGLYIAEDDYITAGSVVVKITDMDRLEARLEVDEYDVHAMTPGTPASIQVLASGASFDGTVSKLDKNGTAVGDLSYYTATVPMNSMEGVYPGMQISAKALRGHTEDAVLLHMSAIQFDEYNQPYVEVGSAQDPQRVDIVIGISDGVYCEILSGVAAGDTVLVPSGMSTQELMMEMRKNSPLMQLGGGAYE